MSRIYTRSGDEGKSSLYNGERFPKSHPVFGILGKADQLNVWLGDAHFLLGETPEAETAKDQLREIQSAIFALSANVATPRSAKTSRRKKDLPDFDADGTATLRMETWIDQIQARLAPLKNFVFPGGGGPLSSTFHHARNICRELERKLEGLNHSQGGSSAMDPNMLPYINRLSDYLFVQARAFSIEPEVTWPLLTPTS